MYEVLRRLLPGDQDDSFRSEMKDAAQTNADSLESDATLGEKS